MFIAVTVASIIFTLGVVIIPPLIIIINNPSTNLTLPNFNFTTIIPPALNETCDYGFIFNGTSCDKCGHSEFNPNVKIVGGIKAIPHSWPSQVMVIQTYSFFFDKLNRTMSLSFLCGGTIINHRTILTAAHCIQDKLINYPYGFFNYEIPVELNEYHPTFESMFTVHAGIFEKSSLQTGLTLNISKYIKHPDYDESSFFHDIGLFILSEPINFNEKINPACLPKEKSGKYPQAEVDCFVAGWGRLNESGKLPNEMNNVKLKIYNRSSCSILSDSASQICAGEYKGGKDTCQGDSGGGLIVIDETSKRQIVAGITSYGNGCARPRSPGIYTRTSYYLDWIKENMVF